MPDYGKLYTHCHQICSKTDTECTQSKSATVAYQVGVHTVGVGIVIILLSVTYITARTHLNNATMYAVCGHLLDNQNRAHSLELYTPSPHIDSVHTESAYRQCTHRADMTHL